MKIKTLQAIALGLFLSGCGMSLNTLKVDIGKEGSPAVSMNIKLKDFDMNRLYYSLGIQINGIGKYLDRDGNGYLDPKDFEENYISLTDGDLAEYFKRYFDRKPQKDSSSYKIFYRFEQK